MKVVELTALHVRIPLKRPIRHASHTRTDTDSIVVRATLSDRSVGYGEGLPREYVTGETIDSSLQVLAKTDFVSQLHTCRDFSAALAMMERLTLAPIPGDDRLCQGNAARCAVELALLDAYGRSCGEPISHVAKMLAPEMYRPREHCQYSGIITSAQGQRARALALMYRLIGFQQLKVKVGIAEHNDVRRLKLIRSWAGPLMDLRVDVNEAWSADSAAEKLRELEPFGITSVEQPLPHEQFLSLPALRKQVKTPIMLDESMCGMVDAERAASSGACDLFNIRLSKVGGFIPALRLVQFARAHQLGCQLGCQVGETAILTAAGRGFACSVDGLRYLEGSYDRHLVKESLGQRDLTFRLGGKAPILVGSGLGFDLDPLGLARVIVRKESLLG